MEENVANMQQNLFTCMVALLYTTEYMGDILWVMCSVVGQSDYYGNTNKQWNKTGSHTQNIDSRCMKSIVAKLHMHALASSIWKAAMAKPTVIRMW